MKRLLWPLVWCVAALPLAAAAIEEDFASDPATRGWRIYGETELFEWNSAAQQLDVTWDSSQRNSYFYHPLGTVLTKSDDVEVDFDLMLKDIAVGLKPSQPFTFELAVGLQNFSEAVSTNFLRGLGSRSPDLLEFTYFPDSGFGATISPVMVSSNNQFVPGFTFPIELTVGDLFHIEMKYHSNSKTLTTILLRNGQPSLAIKDVTLGPTFSDYHLDTVAISSYSDAGADGSLLAHGSVDNVRVVVPDPPITSLQGTLLKEGWQVQFMSQTNWTYTLERTEDWQLWHPVTAAPGTGEPLVLQDEVQFPAIPRAFYRIRADRP